MHRKACSMVQQTTRRRILRILLLFCVVAAIVYACAQLREKKELPQEAPRSVHAAIARTGDIAVHIQALGTVTPPTVTVRSRVDGYLMSLHFTEGQSIAEGDPLAKIDPRPFLVQKQQAEGTLAQNEALLRDARLNLDRFRKLIKEQSVSVQQLQSQEALVEQYQGAVLAGKAAIADAELQLAYSDITAPASGRAGLRQVDVGNLISSSSTEGIVVITQTQPIHVIFTLVERRIPEVLDAMRAGLPLVVESWDQDGKVLIETGSLLSLDNQIDAATGTVKAKAVFDNPGERLFPNQFVNVRLRLGMLENVLIIPTSAVQRNNNGFFVHVIKDGKALMRPIEAGYATDSETVALSGLAAGDVVVTDGVDRLRDGISVTYVPPKNGGQ